MKLNEKIKNYWCYGEITKNGYKIAVSRKKNTYNGFNYNVSIKFSDGDAYADFKIVEFNDEMGASFLVYNNDMVINEEMDYTDTLEDCINGCLYYFHTRY